jgi:colanic acid/amylovoran biosynthesis glycosyltransferase
MRIVYVTQRLPFGIGETFITPEIEALVAAGHELLIVPRLSSDPIVHDDVAALLERTQPIPGLRQTSAALARMIAGQPVRLASAFWVLRHTRPRRRIVYNTLATVQSAWLATVAREWRADHIHAHWAHLTATLAMGASRLSGIPWSFTAHRYDIVLNNLLAEKLRSARFGRFVGREMLEVARSLVRPDVFARAVMIHMGVRVPLSITPPLQRATPVVLCPARLVPIKGHRHLLDAAARLVEQGVRFELWLAGEGPEAAGLAARIHELSLGDRVRMLGTVPHDELLGFYRKGLVDCVVLPSLYEAMGVALMEAMAHGVPTIATRVGGVPELLGDGAGLLVPPENPGALAEAMGGVLESPGRRADLGGAGRRRVAEDFEVVSIAKRLAHKFAGEALGP